LEIKNENNCKGFDDSQIKYLDTDKNGIILKEDGSYFAFFNKTKKKYFSFLCDGENINQDGSCKKCLDTKKILLNKVKRKFEKEFNEKNKTIKIQQEIITNLKNNSIDIEKKELPENFNFFKKLNKLNLKNTGKCKNGKRYFKDEQIKNYFVLLNYFTSKKIIKNKKLN
jgi:DNA-directed RNA polymerase subunit M/transcription elongation factor TFIIS